MQSALQLLHKINQYILNPLIILVFAAAVLIFLFGVFEYIRNSDSEDGRTKGRSHIIAGIFGMFIMVSVFGIIHIILNTIGASAGTTGVNDIIGQ